MRMSTIVGTRGRPNKLIPSLKVTLANMELPSSRVLVAIDDDDEATLAVIDELKALDKRVYISVKPREDSRGEKCDRVLTECPADVYMVQHDSAPLITPDWDIKILLKAQLFPDGIGVVNTDMANASFPSSQAVTAKWVKLVGHIYNHEYAYWYIDHELDDLAKMTGRNPFADVSVETREQHDPEPQNIRTIRLRELHFWTDYFDKKT